MHVSIHSLVVVSMGLVSGITNVWRKVSIALV